MTQKEITLSDGRTIALIFNLATQIAFERISDKAFDLALLTHAEHRLALYYAAIITANKDTDITIEQVMYFKHRDLKLIDQTLNELITEFYDIPKMAEAHVPASETADDEEGDGKKN